MRPINVLQCRTIGYYNDGTGVFVFFQLARIMVGLVARVNVFEVLFQGVRH